MRYKKSSALLELEDTERKLARCNEFKQATAILNKAERLRKSEEAQFTRIRRARLVGVAVRACRLRRASDEQGFC